VRWQYKVLGPASIMCGLLVIAHNGCRERPSPAASPVAALVDVARCESWFLENDPDGNGIRDYWSADIAGLYCFTPVKGSPLKLLSLSLACADADPRQRLWGAWNGEPLNSLSPLQFKLRAIRRRDSAQPILPDQGNGRSLTGFAFCAYPTTYGPATPKTYILNQDGVIYECDTGGKPLEEWPDKTSLNTQWKVVQVVKPQ